MFIYTALFVFFSFFFFFFNDTATTEIYTLSLHDALPDAGAGRSGVTGGHEAGEAPGAVDAAGGARRADRGGGAAEAAAAPAGGGQRRDLPDADDGRRERADHGVHRQGPAADRGDRRAVLHRHHRLRGGHGARPAGQRAAPDAGGPRALSGLHRGAAPPAASHHRPAEGERRLAPSGPGAVAGPRPVARAPLGTPGR